MLFIGVIISPYGNEKKMNRSFIEKKMQLDEIVVQGKPAPESMNLFAASVKRDNIFLVTRKLVDCALPTGYLYHISGVFLNF